MTSAPRSPRISAANEAATIEPSSITRNPLSGPDGEFTMFVPPQGPSSQVQNAVDLDTCSPWQLRNPDHGARRVGLSDVGRHKVVDLAPTVQAN